MQGLVGDFIRKHRLSTDASIRYMDLTSEVGELGKEIIKATDYGMKDFAQTPGTADELGDCLFSLLALSCALGVDAEAQLRQAMDKYEARFAQKGNIASGE